MTAAMSAGLGCAAEWNVLLAKLCHQLFVAEHVLREVALAVRLGQDRVDSHAVAAVIRASARAKLVTARLAAL